MDHQASWTELHLMNVLLGSVLLHRYLQFIMSALEQLSDHQGQPACSSVLLMLACIRHPVLLCHVASVWYLCAIK
jgi:hypothetical protein